MAANVERPGWRVRIRRIRDWSPVGAGVLCTNRHVVTCAYVVRPGKDVARPAEPVQQPDVLKSLFALAMGQHGQKTVGGVPVAKIMSMLSSVFGQAAPHADELMYLDQEAFGESSAEDSALFGDTSTPDRSIYTTLMAVDNDDLAEALESL